MTSEANMPERIYYIHRSSLAGNAFDCRTTGGAEYILATAHDAMVNELKGLLGEAAKAMTDELQHAYRGDCPDVTCHERRDPNCPACQVLLRIEQHIAAAEVCEEHNERNEG